MAVGVISQPYTAVNSCARVPSGVGAAVINTNGYLVLAVTEQVSNVKLECGIAVLPLPCQFAVNVGLAVHINALEANGGANAVKLFIAELFSVPACGGLVKISCFIDHPVVGNIHSCPLKVRRILGINGIF